MDWNSPEKQRLVSALLSLKDAGTLCAFLRDLLTEGEIEEFARRFQAAEMLSRKVPYSMIEKETGFSSTTVARVSKWLNGPGGGYRSVLPSPSHHTSLQLRRGVSL